MRTIYTSCLMTIAALAVATSCGKSDTPTAASGPVDVRLVVSSGNNTRVGSDETDNAIRQLRVYAFNADGEKVGYAEADNLQGQNYIPITLSEDGAINFYVIANDNFGPRPTVGTTSVTDWTSLSKTDLESLKFDLSGFTGWSTTGDFVSPMSNNRYDEFGNDLKNDSGTAAYENDYDYGTAVKVTKPETGTLVIPVTVQHVLGRLRLMLNKDRDADNGLTITVTRATVYHSPNVAHLYTVQGLHNNATNITYRDTPVTEEIISADSPVSLDPQPEDGSYTTIARTYLAPNQYGSSDPDTYTAQKTDGTTSSKGLNEAYCLKLTVEFTYTTTGTSEKKNYTKNYTVYLPRVPRNTSIDVQGTFKGTVVDINPTFNIMVNAWVERPIKIPAFE